MNLKKLVMIFAVLMVSSFSASAIAAISSFRQVTNDIYRGGRPTASDRASLQKQYSMATDIDLDNNNSVNSQEQASAEKLNMQFLLSAMNPLGTPTDSQVNAILADLKDAKNFPIFIHCHYGEDRTGLIIGLYRVEVQGWTAAKAYQEMLADGFHRALVGLDNYFRKRTGYNQ